MSNMHTITISVDDETHRKACEQAERRGVSVPELVEEAFAASVADAEPQQPGGFNPPTELSHEERVRRFREALEELRANNPGFNGGDRLSRDEMYSERIFRGRRSRE